MSLNLSKALEMLLHSRTSRPPPPPMPRIELKEWLDFWEFLSTKILVMGTFILTAYFLELLVDYIFLRYANFTGTLKTNSANS